jgi:hypothetical protein
MWVEVDVPAEQQRIRGSAIDFTVGAVLAALLSNAPAVLVADADHSWLLYGAVTAALCCWALQRASDFGIAAVGKPSTKKSGWLSSLPFVTIQLAYPRQATSGPVYYSTASAEANRSVATMATRARPTASPNSAAV